MRNVNAIFSNENKANQNKLNETVTKDYRIKN